MALINVDEALERILARTPQCKARLVHLDQAGGLVLAQDLTAQLTQPPFHASAMDGYALHAPDGAKQGAIFRLIGEAAAGSLFHGAVSDGEAVRIFTGSSIPNGADTVVIQEDTRLLDEGQIEITKFTEKGKNIRPLGGDFHAGDKVLLAGQRLTPARLALAAAAGYDKFFVTARPRVGILSTGDELIKPGQKPAAGQIIASNAQALAEIVRLHGGEAVDLGLVGDDRAALARALEYAKAAGLDILVTSGGASVGDYDLVQEALKAAAMQLDFWKIAMRPGKPLMFGMLPATEDILVLGLPGNPVSSIVAAHLFLVPMLEKMQGIAYSFNMKPARLKKPVEKNGPRRHYLRGTMEQGAEGEIWVEPASSADSSLLSVLAQADCLIVREAGAPAQAAGDLCQIFIPPFGL